MTNYIDNGSILFEILLTQTRARMLEKALALLYTLEVSSGELSF